MSRLIRIQAKGPFFELDYTVPEKKAPAELRKLKRIHTAGVKPILEKWRDDNARRQRTRWGYKKVRPSLSNYDATYIANILMNAGIHPTTITTTVI